MMRLRLHEPQLRLGQRTVANLGVSVALLRYLGGLVGAYLILMLFLLFTLLSQVITLELVCFDGQLFAHRDSTCRTTVEGVKACLTDIVAAYLSFKSLLGVQGSTSLSLFELP